MNSTLRKILWALILALGEQICQMLRQRSKGGNDEDISNYY